MIIGHDTAREHLQAHLPVATLLFGPPSIGKRTLANHLADHHRVAAADRWEILTPLAVDTVRLITAYAARAPQGPFKLVTARLDGASKPALNALLKTLEEPPPPVKFILLANKATLPTIASRCTTYELGRLSPAELETIYRLQGYPAGKARHAAQHARGQVARGYDVNTRDEHKTQVTTLIKAVTGGDRDTYASVFKTWDARSSELLDTFFTEALTRRWSTFAEADACGLADNRRQLWQMAAALTRFGSARPRLGVRAALEPFLAHR